jgi:hypothetical protein
LRTGGRYFGLILPGFIKIFRKNGRGKNYCSMEKKAV